MDTVRFLNKDYTEQLAGFTPGQLARHEVIKVRLIGVGWNEPAASFLAVNRVLAEDEEVRENARPPAPIQPEQNRPISRPARKVKENIST